MRRAVVVAIAAVLAQAGCGGDPSAPPVELDPRFAVAVVSFTPGPGAGFGQEAMPEIVLGPPHGGVTSRGSQDVVSLGRGGVIVLELGDEIVDHAGADLIVFENPFKVATGGVFAEPGEVAVSDDGETFTAFPCDPSQPSPNGCAGYGVVHAGDGIVDATDAAAAGGDAFDLATVGVAHARFVRITDRGPGGPAPAAGFDLDAVAAAVEER